ncbi:MAG: hypothetical protein PHS80_00020 [Methanothrix sp.]|nr:hypothetical protein [Bacteroidales bacterium]MDD2753885.1 hypothetical protein [Methanothrix sp.]
MSDISEAMIILSDKIGIGVDTLYQLNLSVQMIKAVSNIITIASIFVLIAVSAIIIYRWYNTYSMFDDDAGKLIVFIIGIIWIVIGCLFFQFCIEETALRIVAPQYVAMKDTIAMIGKVI